MRRIAWRLSVLAASALLPGRAVAVGEDEALYQQSLLYAGVLAYCTERQPAQAGAHAQALADWLQRNQSALARGELAARGRDGDGDAAAEARLRVERTIEEIRALPPALQEERCLGLRREIGHSGEAAVPDGTAAAFR